MKSNIKCSKSNLPKLLESSLLSIELCDWILLFAKRMNSNSYQITLKFLVINNFLIHIFIINEILYNKLS